MSAINRDAIAICVRVADEIIEGRALSISEKDRRKLSHFGVALFRQQSALGRPQREAHNLNDSQQEGPMRRIWLRQLAFSLSIFIVSIAAHAQPAELLKPVDPKIVAELEGKTNYAFRRQLYFAKRYRIVEIDFSVLERDGAEVTITPFKDLQTTAQAKKIIGPSSAGQLREWVGEIDSSSIPGVARTMSGETVPIPNMRLFLWIRTGDHQVPLKVARKIAAEKGDQSMLSALGGISSSTTSNQDLNETSLN